MGAKSEHRSKSDERNKSDERAKSDGRTKSDEHAKSKDRSKNRCSDGSVIPQWTRANYRDLCFEVRQNRTCLMEIVDGYFTAIDYPWWDSREGWGGIAFLPEECDRDRGTKPEVAL